MTKTRLIVAAVVVVLVAIGGNAYLGLHNAGVESRLVSQIADTQRIIGKSQKASTETRVTTVSQRCDLTMAIWHLSLLKDPGEAQNLYYSLLGCEGQLNVVKAINARTPVVK